MSSSKSIIHKLVLKINAAELFAFLRHNSLWVKKLLPLSLRKRFPSFGLFIPSANEYPKTDNCQLTRDQVTFKINRSDFVQWRLFYGTKDNALELAKKNISPASIVLDIGANVGGFSLRLAKYCNEQQVGKIQIHSFEPNPGVFDRLKSNVELNPKIADIIQLYPIGISDTTDWKSFDFMEANTGAGRVLNAPDGKLKVQVQTLDEFIEELNPEKISFIKLIIEGSEPAAIKGGWKSINKYKPPIFLEVTRSWWIENNANVEDVLSSLADLGYKFWIEQETEMRLYVPDKHAHLFQYNLLAKT